MSARENTPQNLVGEIPGEIEEVKEFIKSKTGFSVNEIEDFRRMPVDSLKSVLDILEKMDSDMDAYKKNELPADIKKKEDELKSLRDIKDGFDKIIPYLKETGKNKTADIILANDLTNKTKETQEQIIKIEKEIKELTEKVERDRKKYQELSEEELDAKRYFLKRLQSTIKSIQQQNLARNKKSPKAASVFGGILGGFARGVLSAIGILGIAAVTILSQGSAGTPDSKKMDAPAKNWITALSVLIFIAIVSVVTFTPLGAGLLATYLIVGGLLGASAGATSAMKQTDNHGKLGFVKGMQVGFIFEEEESNFLNKKFHSKDGFYVEPGTKTAKAQESQTEGQTNTLPQQTEEALKEQQSQKKFEQLQQQLQHLQQTSDTNPSAPENFQGFPLQGNEGQLNNPPTTPIVTAFQHQQANHANPAFLNEVDSKFARLKELEQTAKSYMEHAKSPQAKEFIERGVTSIGNDIKVSNAEQNSSVDTKVLNDNLSGRVTKWEGWVKQLEEWKTKLKP